VLEIAEGRVTRREVVPEDFGVGRACLDDLKGGSAEENAGIVMAVLEGRSGPARDVVVVNAAAALVAAGKAGGFREAVPLAIESIDRGAALARLNELRRFTVEAG
jgi:anthranilate phosphoribosyltransferase